MSKTPRSRLSILSVFIALPLMLTLVQCGGGSSTTPPITPITPIIPDTDTANITTYHYDNVRSGLQSQETVLTPTNVNSTTFGKLFSVSVDAAVYAQPLIATKITMSDGQPHTLLLIATENDSVYAFDADASSTTPFWNVSLLATGEVPVPYTDTGSARGIGPAVGITGTPVLDLTQNILYVVAKSKSATGSYIQRLHALQLKTGAEALNGPTAISAFVAGAAPDATNGGVAFNPLRQHQRCALGLANGTVWIAWASHSDYSPYHGWLIGYSSTDISKQSYVFDDTPNGGEGGIWMSAGGPSFDSAGNIYVNTGNGTFNDAPMVNDFSSSALRLVPGTGQNGTMKVADYFTPFNQINLSAVDADFGVANAMLLPDASGNAQHPHLLVTTDKNATVYLLDRDDMGKFNSVTNNVLQQFSASSAHIKQNPLFFNNTLYMSGDGVSMTAFPFDPTTGQFQITPSMSTSEIFACTNCYTGGSAPTISSNGANNPILWTLENSATSLGGPAILRAYNPADLSKELYDSTQATANRDQAAPAVTFTTPVVANGKVYVGGNNAVTVYGLLPK